MITWLTANLSTILVLAVIFGIAAAIIVKMVRDRKKGKGGCSCGCAGCPGSATCQSSQDR